MKGISRETELKRALSRSLLTIAQEGVKMRGLRLKKAPSTDANNFLPHPPKMIYKTMYFNVPPLEK